MADPVSELLLEWQLTRDGAPVPSSRATVVPVRTRGGALAVLKVGGGPDSALEHLALTRWDGEGAVRLLRADPRRRALLLDRLAGQDLSEVWDLQACEVVAGLYRQLHRPVGAPFVQLSDHVSDVLEGLGELPRSAPLPRRLVEQAVALGRDFTTDEATDGILVHADLHYGHVLADAEGGWQAISPRPLSGDPHYEPAPMLLHRFDELAGDVRDGVRRRFHTLIDTAGLDEERARDWVIVRMVAQAWADLSAGHDDTVLTRCIAVAKAVQD